MRLAERDFYRELNTVPDVPATMYDSIHSVIKRRSRIKQTVLAIAASLILYVGTSIVYNVNFNKQADYIAPEVSSELQIIHDYLNGNTINTDLDQYVALDNDFTN